jgi:hypothetical protein
MSAILLIPCFWQRRIEAGDLGSHIYNAWLAEQIERGAAPGLAIQTVTTNVLFDLILSGLYRAFGSEAAQRLAVSAATLLFFWGAFALIESWSGRPAWSLAPSLMMLSYGWVFHMGFFNFYLALGLSLWALALSERRARFAGPGAAVLLATAYTAHALAPVWAVIVIAYRWLARKASFRSRLILLAAAIGGVTVFRWWVTGRYRTFASFQPLEASAVDQVCVFGIKYFAVSILLALLWSFLLLGVLHAKGAAGMMGDVSFQLCILMAFGIMVLPTQIELPQYNVPLDFVTERMSLPQGVLVCVLLAAANPPPWLRAAFVPLALVYFSLLYVDTRAYGKAEASMEALTAGLTTRDRVFTSLVDPLSRVQPFTHMLARVCVARCLSYDNYEPYSAAFRVRVLTDNALVVRTAQEHDALDYGGYVVRDHDAPLYQVQPCDSVFESFCIKALQPGEVTKSYKISPLPLLW